MPSPNKILIFYFSCISISLFSAVDIHASVSIPQTGQTTTFLNNDDGENQAGQAWPAQRFLDNQDGTITDNLTGLMWLKDADCATENISGSITFQWTSVLQFANDLNSDALVNRCNNYTKDYTDWRIPNVNEIGSLMRAGLVDRTIANWLNIPDNNSAGFSQTNLVDNPIWTSTTSAQDSNQVWIANLETGGFELANKTNRDYSAHIFSAVRDSPALTEATSNTFAPVLTTNQSTIFRGGDDGTWNKGVHAPALRFITQENGTIIDKLTGLIWIVDTNCATQIESTWYDTINSTVNRIVNDELQEPELISNCGLTAETEQEWRIPNINELKSLIDYSEANPALPSNHPFTINTDREFWSSTSSNASPNASSNAPANGVDPSFFAWSINFYDGQINALTDKNTLAYAWPVTGPITFPDIISTSTTVDFGELFVDSQTEIQKLTIKNNGKLPLSISSLYSSNPNFLIQPTPCTSMSNGVAQDTVLEPNETCEISIQFTPTENRNYAGKITVFSDALGSNEYVIELSGSGANVSGTLNEKGDLNCFIATAAYGSYLDGEVVLLREFRDNYLLTNAAGQAFVNFYYEHSPSIANAIKQDDALRFFTRVLLTPIVYFIKHPFFAFIFTSLLLLLLSRRAKRIETLQ